MPSRRLALRPLLNLGCATLRQACTQSGGTVVNQCQTTIRLVILRAPSEADEEITLLPDQHTTLAPTDVPGTIRVENPLTGKSLEMATSERVAIAGQNCP